MAVPMRADIRRQDRPGHVGEMAREEGGGQFDDVMLRFEPGHEMRLLLAADFAEADKGMHLVLVAAHGFCHGGDLGHVRIGRDIKQIVTGSQPPQQAIEQGEPLGLRCRIATSASSTNLAGTLNVPAGGSSGGAVGSNSSSASP